MAAKIDIRLLLSEPEVGECRETMLRGVTGPTRLRLSEYKKAQMLNSSGKAKVGAGMLVDVEPSTILHLTRRPVPPVPSPVSNP